MDRSDIAGRQEKDALDALAEDREFDGECVVDDFAFGQENVGGQLETVEVGALEVGQRVMVHGLDSFL